MICVRTRAQVHTNAKGGQRGVNLKEGDRGAYAEGQSTGGEADQSINVVALEVNTQTDMTTSSESSSILQVVGQRGRNQGCTAAGSWHDRHMHLAKMLLLPSTVSIVASYE